MTVKLKLENGEIKEYETLCMDYWGEGYTEYSSECGIRWNSCSSETRPSNDEGCDHLDCAIHASKYPAFKLKIASVSTIMFVPIFYLFGWGGFKSLILFGVLGYFLSRWDRGRYTKELEEFKMHGTVNGIRAHQIFENAEREAEIERLRKRFGGFKPW